MKFGEPPYRQHLRKYRQKLSQKLLPIDRTQNHVNRTKCTGTIPSRLHGHANALKRSEGLVPSSHLRALKSLVHVDTSVRPLIYSMTSKKEREKEKKTPRPNTATPCWSNFTSAATSWCAWLARPRVPEFFWWPSWRRCGAARPPGSSSAPSLRRSSRV